MTIGDQTLSCCFLLVTGGSPHYKGKGGSYRRVWAEQFTVVDLQKFFVNSDQIYELQIFSQLCNLSFPFLDNSMLFT